MERRGEEGTEGEGRDRKEKGGKGGGERKRSGVNECEGR